MRNIIFGGARQEQIDLGLAILRVISGVIFMAHGAQKVFGFGFDGVAGAFASMGVPFAGVMGPMVALLELFGGLALVLGVLTRVFASGLAVTMLVAALLVHLPAGFMLPDGYEFVLLLFGAASMLTLTGGGRYSVDAALAERTLPAAARA